MNWPQRGMMAAILILLTALGCARANESEANEPRFELRVVRSRSTGPVLLRFDRSTGHTWGQPILVLGDVSWSDLGSPVDVDEALADRFRLVEVSTGEDVTIVVADTAGGGLWSRNVLGSEGWRPIVASVEPVSSSTVARYDFMVIRSMMGVRFTRLDQGSGDTVSMSFSGEGGWRLPKELAENEVGSPIPRRVPPRRPLAAAKGEPAAAAKERPKQEPRRRDSEVKVLLDSLEGDLPAPIRAWAARELASKPVGKAAPPLRAALADESPEVVAAAATSLGALGDQAALETLKRLQVDHNAKSVRDAAKAAVKVLRALPETLRALPETTTPKTADGPSEDR